MVVVGFLFILFNFLCVLFVVCLCGLLLLLFFYFFFLLFFFFGGGGGGPGQNHFHFVLNNDFKLNLVTVQDGT